MKRLGLSIKRKPRAWRKKAACRALNGTALLQRGASQQCEGLAAEGYHEIPRTHDYYSSFINYFIDIHG